MYLRNTVVILFRECCESVWTSKIKITCQKIMHMKLIELQRLMHFSKMMNVSYLLYCWNLGPLIPQNLLFSLCKFMTLLVKVCCSILQICHCRKYTVHRTVETWQLYCYTWSAVVKLQIILSSCWQCSWCENYSVATTCRWFLLWPGFYFTGWLMMLP